MSDLGQAASKIGEKIVDILDVFDLSFFISGAVGIAAISMALPDSFGKLVGITPGSSPSGTTLFGLVLGSYVVGLIAFAAGRLARDKVISAFAFVRRKEVQDNAHIFHAALVQQCGYDDDARDAKAAIKRDFGYDIDLGPAEQNYSAAYTRMWAHLRSYPELAESFTLAKRYWTLAATYDGVASALLLWIFAAHRQLWSSSGLAAGIAWAALALAAFACWHRARQYKRYQIEEIVATTAHWIAVVGKPWQLGVDKQKHELGNGNGAISPAPAPARAGSPES